MNIKNRIKNLETVIETEEHGIFCWVLNDKESYEKKVKEEADRLGISVTEFRERVERDQYTIVRIMLTKGSTV